MGGLRVEAWNILSSKTLPLGLAPGAGSWEGLQAFWVPQRLENTCIKTKGQRSGWERHFLGVVEGLDG